MLWALQKDEKAEQQDVLLHSLSGAEECLCDVLQVTMVNVDHGKAFTDFYYSDTTLHWFAKRSSKYHASDKTKFYLRVVQHGRLVFLGSSRNQTLLDLEINDEDIVETGIFARSEWESISAELIHRTKCLGQRDVAPNEIVEGGSHAMLLQIIAEHATEDISEDQVMCFYSPSAQILGFAFR